MMTFVSDMVKNILVTNKNAGYQHLLSFLLSFLHELNSLPNDKILDWSKRRELADNEIKLGKIMIYVSDRVENIVGKGEKAGYQHFLLFPHCFQKAFYSGSLKVVMV